ncbi:MAG: helix-turn-helix domain-containing protein [Ruminococcus sp.]|nr:helix-turn-helix domain-containing protein [Ruminococcus sp.]MCM1380299.1 helix-turn-helix domain-containing protein [Muribaculaceae bacterium]MCM1478279.1 helix-turn-helix domain-containing protein [Muribaculaceae bacterium]
MKRKKDYFYNWDEVPVVLDPPYVAWLLGCTDMYVRKLCREGKLPAFKLGGMWRVRKDELEAYTKGVK